MPQVDLETLVSVCAGGGSDRKITCETLAESGATEEQDLPHKDNDDVPVVEVPPDFPPESFWLSKDAEFDWFDRNAFFERKESTKGSTFLYGNPTPGSNSNSQRFSSNLKSKASILGLPKTQKANYIDCKRRNNKPANIHLFPTRSQSAGKTSVGMPEPSSPKVSCMGRVRSKRCQRRSTGNSRKKEKSVARSRSDDHDNRGRKGLYKRVMSMFTGRREKKTSRSPSKKVEVKESTVEEAPRKSAAFRMSSSPVGTEPAAEPPALGGMKKFASGRRSGSWTTDDFDVALSTALNEGPTKRS